MAELAAMAESARGYVPAQICFRSVASRIRHGNCIHEGGGHRVVLRQVRSADAVAAAPR